MGVSCAGWAPAPSRSVFLGGGATLGACVLVEQGAPIFEGPSPLVFVAMGYPPVFQRRTTAPMTARTRPPMNSGAAQPMLTPWTDAAASRTTPTASTINSTPTVMSGVTTYSVHRTDVRDVVAHAWSARSIHWSGVTSAQFGPAEAKAVPIRMWPVSMCWWTLVVPPHAFHHASATSSA